ncbi:MAG: hypothetical protein DWH81_00950, partial [Planctomycetota bacterium]
MFTSTTTQHNKTRNTFWMLASFASLMMILGGMTLCLAKETRLVLPNAAQPLLKTAAQPDQLHGDSDSPAAPLMGQSRKVEQPPDLIQVAVRPNALRPASTIPARNEITTPSQLPAAAPSAQPHESDPERLQLRIRSRYQDAKMLSLLNSTNLRQMTSLFLEVSQS